MSLIIARNNLYRTKKYLLCSLVDRFCTTIRSSCILSCFSKLLPLLFDVAVCYLCHLLWLWLLSKFICVMTSPFGNVRSNISMQFLARDLNNFAQMTDRLHNFLCLRFWKLKRLHAVDVHARMAHALAIVHIDFVRSLRFFVRHSIHAHCLSVHSAQHYWFNSGGGEDTEGKSTTVEMNSFYERAYVDDGHMMLANEHMAKFGLPWNFIN